MKKAEKIPGYSHPGLASWSWEIAADRVGWSPELFRIFGLDQGEEAPNWAQQVPLYTPESREKLCAAGEECIRSGKPYRLNIDGIHSSGRLIHLEAWGEADRDKTGKVTRLFGQIIDHTEFFKTREMLSASDEAFSLFFENAPLGTTLSTPDGRWVRVNSAFAKMLGYSKEELEGRHFREMTHPEDLETSEANVKRILDGETSSFSIEKRYINRVGSTVWAITTVSAVRKPDGAPLYSISQSLDITEKKKLQQITAENTARLSAIIDSPQRIIIFSLDRQYRYLQFSKAHRETIEKIWGKRIEVGMSMLNVIGNPADQRKARHNFDRALQGECFVVNEEYGTPSLSRFFYECHYSPIRHETGSIHGLTVFVLDITNRMKAEEKIRQLSRANEALGECNDVVLHCGNEKDLLSNICRIVVELGGMKLAWIGMIDEGNSKVLPVATYGNGAQEYAAKVEISVREEEPTGRGPSGMAIRGKRPVWCNDLLLDDSCRPWHALMAHHDLHSCLSLPIIRNEKSAGSLNLYGGRTMQFSGEMIALFERITANLGFALDNLDRAKERALSIERLREQAELLDAASDGILVKDMEDRIIYWSRGAEAIYGWSSAEMLGRKAEEVLAVNPGQFDLAMSELLNKGLWRGGMERKTKDGRILTVDTRWTLLRDEKGNPKSVLSINTDITEHKKLEAQLLRTQKMESIGTLANGIAHDLNNALAPTLLALDILGDRITDSTDRELIETMRQSTQHGADLVKQVLSFARGTEGQRLTVCLNAVWKGIEKVIRDSFPKNITFNVTSSPDLQVVNGDPTQLHQVFMNLCVNARDAMPNGGKLDISMENTVFDEVYAGLNPVAKAGSYVLIQVSDNGTGIAKNIQERIFDPFFTTKETGKGTGLGLPTVMTIVKSHGGFINLHSEEGKGSTFSIYLPSAKSAETSKPPHEELPHTQASPKNGHGETILLVDDEEKVLSVAKMLLKKAGYEVMTGTNGAEALALYAQHREKIDVVLTDMAMPVMDGRATILALREMNPGVKIIASSGQISNTDTTGIEKLGVRHFIPKPYTASTVLRVLAEALTEKP